MKLKMKLYIVLLKIFLVNFEDKLIFPKSKQKSRGVIKIKLL